jgi:two-component system, chemotaxis family, chemotaxis protein CheY
MLPAAESRPVERLRVLVVDPDGDTRSLYRQVLELAGHDIIEAADGRDALVKALEAPPSFVVTETRLPMMDGFALCEILRQDRLTHSVPILVVTSDARAERLARVRAAGASAVLVKPVELDAILEEMKRLTDSAGENGDGRAARPVPGPPPRVDVTNDRGARVRTTLSKTHQRFDTTAPPAAPPMLHCPGCDAALTYQYSHIGGVSSRHPEQWDYYLCPRSCGTFEYRQRTRRVRRVADPRVPALR